MADAYEPDLANKAAALKVWRATLARDPQTAEAAIKRAIGQLLALNIFHHTEIARFHSQMRNGVACPGEFGVSEAFGCPKRA